MVLFEENVKNLLTDDAKIGTFISARLLSDNDPTVPARSGEMFDSHSGPSGPCAVSYTHLDVDKRQLLHTLRDRGYLTLDDQDHHYRIGRMAFRIGNTYLDEASARCV